MAGIAIKITGADFSASGLGRVTLKGSSVPVTGISISGPTSITNTGQYAAVLTPSNTTQTAVVWSITSGSNYATIDQNGLVTAKAGASNSAVTIKCTSAANSSISATKTIHVTHQIAVTGIAISGPDTVSGTGQYSAALTPSNTTQTDVVWSITSGSTYASIDQNGLVTAKAGASNSSVTIKCASADNSEVFATKTISVTNVVPLTAIAISGPDTVTDSGQFSAELTPRDTTQTGVRWLITAGSSYASIDTNGLVTAKDGADNSSVTITCVSTENSSISVTKTITVTKSQQLPSLVSDGLIRNYDAYGASSNVLTDQVDGTTQATFNGAAGTNCIEITSSADGNTQTGAAWEKMLNGLSTWTLEYVIEAMGFADSANASADIYHDTSTEVNGKFICYLGAVASQSITKGGVHVRYSSSWKTFEFDNAPNIDWRTPHVIHLTREVDSEGMTFKLYVDGVLAATASGTAAGTVATYANKVVFLASKGSRKLYALRAYNKALSAAEAAQNNSYNVDRYSLS